MPKKIILKSFDEINKERKRTRLIFILASLPFLLVIGLFGYKAMTMYETANSSINSFTDKDYKSSLGYAEKQKSTNFLEQWLAHYNSGTAYAGLKDWKNANSELIIALDLLGNKVPQVCYVRANLAITYEKLGDAAKASGDTTSSDKYYWQASQTATEAPLECLPPEQNGTASEDSDEGEAGKSLVDTKERSDKKRSGGDNSVTNPDPGQGEEENPQSPAKSDRDKIQDQMDQSDKNRTEDENADRSQGTGGATKPW